MIRIIYDNKNFKDECSMATKTKTCSKCGETKPLDEFHNHKIGKYDKNSVCKECKKKLARKYRQEHPKEKKESDRKSYQKHKKERNKKQKEWYERTGREQQGSKSMYENKMCANYLGIVIGERLCRHLFKDVEVMPHGNTGYDIVCNKGKKIDIKSGCIVFNKGYPRWQFNIGRNKIADFFILVAFDNVEDLNPLHLWMIPGHEINHKTSKSIRPPTLHKWDKWKRSIEEVQLCCTEMKNTNKRTNKK